MKKAGASQNSYLHGLVRGLPIGLGYLSVSFGFGITAVSAGLTALSAILISLTNLTSAGQLAGVFIIAEGGSLFEMFLAQLTINIRYCLMGIALTQKLDHSFTTPHRLLTAFGITDENFAMAMAEPGLIGRRYLYGLISLPIVGWTLGTALGVYASELLPATLCAALGIAIYAMFTAIIIPPAKKDRGVLYTVFIASAASCAFYYIPFLKGISQGFSVIFCALFASGLMAYLMPKKVEEEGGEA